GPLSGATVRPVAQGPGRLCDVLIEEVHPRSRGRPRIPEAEAGRWYRQAACCVRALLAPDITGTTRGPITSSGAGRCSRRGVRILGLAERMPFEAKSLAPSGSDPEAMHSAFEDAATDRVAVLE